MKGKINGLKLFGNSLHNAAARSLKEKHPQYVETFVKMFKETADFSKALSAVETIPTDIGFAKWRPLLTVFFDTELAINQIKTTLNLLAIVPTQDISISEGAWTYYHVNAWFFWMDALLERTKKLIRQGVRTLVRPFNPNWKAVGDDLLKSIDLLSRDIGKIRDPLAHGGGSAEVPAQERLWEGIVLFAPYGDYEKSLFDGLFEPMKEYRDSWSKRYHEKLNLALDVIGKEMGELNSLIDWDRV